MKKIILATIFVAFSSLPFAASAAMTCSLQPGDAGFNGPGTSGLVLLRADGSVQVQCPSVDVTVVGKSADEHGSYTVTGDGAGFSGKAVNKRVEFPITSAYEVVPAVDGSGYTFSTSGECKGQVTYGQRAKCTITYTPPAPPVVQSAPASTPQPTVTPQVIEQVVQQAIQQPLGGTAAPTSSPEAATTTQAAGATSTPETPVGGPQATSTATSTASTTPTEAEQIASLRAQIQQLIAIIIGLIQKMIAAQSI